MRRASIGTEPMVRAYARRRMRNTGLEMSARSGHSDYGYGGFGVDTIRMGGGVLRSNLAFDGHLRLWKHGEGEPTYFAEFERDGKRYEASGVTPPIAVQRLMFELWERGMVG